MRVLLLVMLLLSPWLAAADNAQAYKLFELAGINVLCEQSAPLAQKGLSEDLQKRVAAAFSAQGLCDELAQRLATKLTPEQFKEALALLQTPLAQGFTAAERAVGESEDGSQGLAAYRQQLKERPPLPARLQLVQRLDAASHTTDLATLLRYEAGKTQAWLSLQQRGQSIDEQALSAQTTRQAEELRSSSAQAVESFMLYAYRQMPSDQLTQYAELYEQPAVSLLMSSSLQLLPQLFAQRRAKLK
ncbi:hypothetical protein [Pseudomonas sp. 5P_3.1_Bac2]|uniref:hypothetical protein n=1 Tax=Pseudomonas sp. 5P_3.1_Bac2 TaxID=2971617 RepID=UPI0021C8D627|nr:hypothetical protein [Pseudomonas sp. 5P_3.1_Bac2]MCU1718938.1 hypothetical protein [Pseudomonas sp. 5P_3.1_Bac2]